MGGRASGAFASLVGGSPIWSDRLRRRILRFAGVDLARDARIQPYVRFVGSPRRLSVRSGAFVNVGLLVGANADIVIAERASLGPNVQLIPTTHEIGPHEQRAGATTSAPIRIGRGSWIGAGVTVLGGVDVGDGCVIAAGSVVTRDCEPDGLYGGTPAKLLRKL
ncbi:maltose O-acetyltransferase [Agromyces terreus]|uniref:Maltose O-acetyltransferase n=1 Tax=Agromyces terreus TaxID=424795 RepID=A0A9X2H239_9MICO|nr:DapH/DapD/GlmU-related protein [Agromyces terreus]MCP2369452.1 maltose O-acetyltransferase [Agromyces terreus]